MNLASEVKPYNISITDAALFYREMLAEAKKGILNSFVIRNSIFEAAVVIYRNIAKYEYDVEYKVVINSSIYIDNFSVTQEELQDVPSTITRKIIDTLTRKIVESIERDLGKIT